MRKQFHEWVYFVAVKNTEKEPVTVLFKEVWMVHKAVAYIDKEEAEEWKAYVDGNAVNISYYYDDDDNMVITDAFMMGKER